MAIIDEFSYEHPDNKGYGRSKRLRLLPSSDSGFLTIERQFHKGWKHPNKPRPKIHAIFKILSSDSSLLPYHRYRAIVTASPALRNRTKNPANEQFLFHGTNRHCTLAEDSSRVRLCVLSKCNLCCIIRNSFDVKKCGSKHRFRRFGTGIYTTACSSKADDYALNADESTSLRVLVVSRVVVGNPYKRRQNATGLTEPPCGHHSVVGEPGIDLNYEETVVYDNDAIRPAFLVVYGDAPASKSKLHSLVAMSSMTSHIPLALSILGTLAGSLTQKAASTPPAPPSVAPLVAAPPAPPLPASAPLNVPPPKPSSGTTGAVSNSASNNVGATPPATNPIALCEVCQIRPKHFDGTKIHPYCGKTCANKRLNSNAASGPVNSNNCNFCHNRPKYSDGTKTHDYCSKACARNAIGPQRKATGGGSTAALCQAPGCQNPPHPGHDYCSMAHKTLGENLCLMCLQAPKMANSHFCSQTCIDDAESKGPMILEVPSGHVTFKSVADQFKASWRHGSACPPVRRVYKILVPPALLSAYNSYKTAVETRGQFVAAGRAEGNENRRWHGTRRICNLGDKGHTQFCSTPSCSLCCIIRTSYDISLWGKKTGWGRFGKGIYTSSTSSKSNDYSHNDCKSNLKAILLNKVIVGKGCKLLQDNTSLTAPPAGFDSVLAEKGGSLNYDELVVYTNDAIRPSYLVMYEP
ncbi:hypothetical protein CVT26_005143 [Gymnopilus dilepis]|uniref:PARP catalytic domain-containing protein n=1 Tax=Gymnopilus dilepis TaxID=231916 RepID=A0A409WJ01_9AGAR|nr:hypothetical protein CVT26_005143 [Gymnopilus dilepis]